MRSGGAPEGSPEGAWTQVCTAVVRGPSPTALPSDLRPERQELRSALEEALNREGPMVYHVIINYDVAEYR